MCVCVGKCSQAVSGGRWVWIGEGSVFVLVQVKVIKVSGVIIENMLKV